MKSLISNHETPKEAILQRIDTVTSSAYLSEIIEMGCLEVMVYLLGNLKYNITYINGSVLTFELENIYCFKFQKGGKDHEKRKNGNKNSNKDKL